MPWPVRQATASRTRQDVRPQKGMQDVGYCTYIPAVDFTRLGFSAWTRKTMFRCDESTFSFSSRNTLSTPYSWRVEKLTKRPKTPARSLSITKFFFPRTCSATVRVHLEQVTQEGRTPSRRWSSSLLALSFRKPVSGVEIEAIPSRHGVGSPLL